MSALTLFKGDPPWWYSIVNQGVTQNPALGTAGLIDASGEKCAALGVVWHPTQKTGTINIRKIHFPTGAVTFNALSTLRVSLQNVSLTAGPPYQPDGTQDQTYDFVGAGVTANSWITTGNLSADRAVDLSAVNPGDANSRWVSIVWEYQTFTAADSVIINGLTLNSTSLNTQNGSNALINTGSWAIQGNIGSVIALECDDGTFAFLDQCLPFNAFSAAAVSSSAAIRACGLKFLVPVQMSIEGFGVLAQVPNSSDGTLTIYDSDGTTVLVSVVVDNDAVASATQRLYLMCRFQPITLAANTYYRAVFVGTSTTSTNIPYGTVNAAALMDGLPGGQDFHWTQRDSAGTWTDTTTQRPIFAMKLSSVHDGASSGGGLIRHPGMNGGLNA